MKLIVILLALALTGCASLIIREDDSFSKKAAKVTARVIVAVPTMAVSEGWVHAEEHDEELGRELDAAVLIPGREVQINNRSIGRDIRIHREIDGPLEDLEGAGLTVERIGGYHLAMGDVHSNDLGRRQRRTTQ